MKIGLKDGVSFFSPVFGSVIVSLPMPSSRSLGDAVGRVGPDVDDLVVALAVGDQAFLILLDDGLDLVLRLVEDLLLATSG